MKRIYALLSLFIGLALVFTTAGTGTVLAGGSSWTQTTKADFEAGVLSRVDITSSSGDVKLAAGYLYALQGSGTKKFYRYDVAGDNWTTLADTLSNVQFGGSVVFAGNYVYAFQGNDTKTFWRYDIAGNSWTAMTSTPEKVSDGGALVYTGTYIYALQGNYQNRFWRYDIAGNTWTANGVMANTPGAVGSGGALTFDGTYIYALQGDTTTAFWRYNIAANTWTAMTSTPLGVQDGGALTFDGTYIYALQGDTTTTFWRYSISGNSWTAMTNTPAAVGPGGGLTYDRNYIYALQGNYTTTFWRYNIAGNSWEVKAVTPAAVGDCGGNLARNGYAASGTIASQVLDTTKGGTAWNQLSWTETIQANTDITFEVRASDTIFAKDAGTPTWTSVGGTSPVNSGLPLGRYMQWRATLTSTNIANTPTLQDVTVTYTYPGITVSLISGNTTEAGGTATFTIVLDTQPTDNVTIGLSSSDNTEGTVSPASVTFTTGNWSTPQTITVTGVNDWVMDGNIAYSIVTAAATSGDVNYNGINPADVSVTNNDNDTAGITLNRTSGLVTTEAGGTDTFTIVLNSEPTDNVTIGLSSSDNTEGTVSPASVIFTAGNWNTPQTVTVTGVDDALADGNIAYSIVTAAATSIDPNYSGMTVSDVAVTNTDNDAAGITLNRTSGLVTTEAGGTDTFTIRLNTQPTDNVTIGLSSSDNTEGTVSPASVIFTSGNWDTPQTVTVTGVNDLVDDGDIAYTIVTDNATSTDVNYNGLNASDVSVTNNDNDVAGITVSLISGNTTEAGGIATFTIYLNSEPTDNVTIGLSSSDITEGTVSTDNVTFTPTKWSTPATFVVTGVDDDVDDGDIAYTIVTDNATSTDVNYNGLNASDVAVTNTDNDTAGITVTPTSGLVTTEAGGTDNFTIVLTSQPTDNVTIGLSSSDTSEGTVSTDNVTFTALDWNTPQTVIVTGVNDFIVDGNIAYTIVTAPAVSADLKYNVVDASDVGVTNNDDGDTAGITVIPTTGLVTTEAGGTDNFTIVLTSQPTDNVTIGLSSSDTSEGTVSTDNVTFTALDWNIAQTVIVTGVNDFIVDGNIAYTIITDNATSADPNYNGLNPSDVSVTNRDNDVAGGGGGGGGGGENVVPTNTLRVVMLGKQSGVKVTNDGIIVEPSVVVSLEREATLRLDKGTRLLSGGDEVPISLALTVADEPPPPPEGMVIVSQVYDCVAYSNGGVPIPVSFDPPASFLMSYNPEKAPKNASAIFIAYYDEQKGWVRLNPPSGSVAEAGTAIAQLEHFCYLAVLAELPPTPPAYFEVRNLNISPSQVNVGQEVIISAQIANTGGMSGEYTLIAKVEGLLETSQVMELTPGQSQEVSFTVAPGSSGSYRVEIGGLEGNFVVVAPPPAPPAPAAKASGFKWLTPWSISVIAAMVLAAVALTFVRRRRQPAVVVEKPSEPIPTVVEKPSEPIPTVVVKPSEPTPTVVVKPSEPTPTVVVKPSEPTPTVVEKPSEPAPVPSRVRNLEIIPNRVKPGGTIYVFAEVTNTGPTTSSFSLVLKVRDIVEAVKEITLGPGQSQKVVFMILRDEPGVYHLDLEGLKGSFIISSAETTY